jgi:hypothetical protein
LCSFNVNCGLAVPRAMVTGTTPEPDVAQAIPPPSEAVTRATNTNIVVRRMSSSVFL